MENIKTSVTRCKRSKLLHGDGFTGILQCLRRGKEEFYTSFGALTPPLVCLLFCQHCMAQWGISVSSGGSRYALDGSHSTHRTHRGTHRTMASTVVPTGAWHPPWYPQISLSAKFHFHRQLVRDDQSPFVDDD